MAIMSYKLRYGVVERDQEGLRRLNSISFVVSHWMYETPLI